jgi:hypothetical protein
MSGFAYLDTDAFHCLGRTFQAKPLREDLRGRILLSPITFLEALTHLTLKTKEEVLAHFRAIRNWSNPRDLRLLPWPSHAIAEFAFCTCTDDLEFPSLVEGTINSCLVSESATEFHEAAGELKNLLDDHKKQKAAQFRELVNLYPAAADTGADLSLAWVRAIADRAKVSIDARPLSEVLSKLSAYHEYEQERIKVAANNASHVPDENDVFDSEQLVYLADPNLHFVTCDGGYLKRIKKSPQLSRIHRIPIEVLRDSTRIEGLLARITS